MPKLRIHLMFHLQCGWVLADVHMYLFHRHWAAIAIIFSLIVVLLFSSLRTGIVANLTLVEYIQAQSLLPVLPMELVRSGSRHPTIDTTMESLALGGKIRSDISPNALAAVSALSGLPVGDQGANPVDRASSSLVRFWQAFSFSQRHEMQEANEIIKSDPQLVRYLAVSGVRALDNGDYADGIELLKAATTLGKAYLLQPVVYKSLSKALNTYESNREEALWWAHKWIDSDPTDANAYIWAAALYLWSGYPELAHQVLLDGHSSGVEQHRSFPGQMGQIYQARQEWATAIHYYRRSWDLTSNYPQERELAAWYLGSALAQNGQVDEAQDYLQIAIQSGTPAVHKQASELLSKLRGN